MATNATIIHNWGSLPEGYQATSPNDFVQQLAKILTSYLSGTYNVFNYGNATPSAEDQDKPWIRTNVDGSFDRLYTYSGGKWVSPHHIPASDARRWPYVGTLGSIDTLDGGTAGVATTTTGPFWEVDAAFAARFPVGAGAFAASGTVSVTGTTTDTAVSGEDKHTLVASELASHGHSGITMRTCSHGSGSTAHDGETVDFLVSTENEGTAEARSATIGGLTVACDTGHNNLPPFYGVYFIKRTVRTQYVAT